ncbi:MAG TPA: hypothetical protein VFT32_12955 [Candidatus Eisenbacteria bacterium]|nr:hypothetical protein [Candidatus Eisenbacteria bacterium]
MTPRPRMNATAPPKPRPDAGFSVVMVTATIVVLLVMGLSLAALVSENSGLSLHHVESNRAFYAAQAGVEFAIAKLEANPSWGGLPAPGKALDQAAFWVEAPSLVDGDGAPLPPGVRRIVATGVSGEATRVVEARIAVGGIVTIAGSGLEAYAGDGGPAAAAGLLHPSGVAYGPDGSLYVADTDHHAVRRIDAATGVITTVAGIGAPGYAGDGGPAAAARLRAPRDVAVAENGDLYVADTGNHAIRKVAAATGLVTTIAGKGSPGFGGDGAEAAGARLNAPSALAIAANGDLYVADRGNNRVRRVAATTGIISTFAGTGSDGFGGDGGPATAARLSRPSGVDVALNGDVYIADTFNHAVRRVAAATGVIATVAGTGVPGRSGDDGPALDARLYAPESVAAAANGDVWVADAGNHSIRRFTPGGTIAAVAGTGAPGYAGDGGPPTAARLNQPCGLAVDASGAAAVADRGNHRIRRTGRGTTIVGWTEPRT